MRLKDELNNNRFEFYQRIVRLEESNFNFWMKQFFIRLYLHYAWSNSKKLIKKIREPNGRIIYKIEEVNFYLYLGLINK
jgi:hypothetical protein